MQFRVLGPLEADAGEGPIPLGGRKQRAVLASLLVRANEVVSADALIEDVWGEDAPDTARNILQTYVANLRKALGDDRLQGRPPGYVLSVGPAELDSVRFDDLVIQAKRAMPVDPKVAIATFEDALALWRGPALADLHEQSSLLAEAARLDELRLDAQEDRIEALLATGANGRALAELEPLLQRHTLRESLWGLAMLASYRDGRQGEALNTFGRARELLADELGIDPSPELARLHERILKQDPGLELRGEPLRGYRLLERIGAGSVGVVFRGVQPHVGRDVAIKVFDERIAADPDFVARFEHDAQIVAALEHPHIVPMYDYWREPGRAYVVTRYMRGGSLRGFRERGADVDRQRALYMVAQVASALGFAHRQGVGHGGVHPSSVLLDVEGNAYLSDFHIGTGPPPDPTEDLRALERWSRELLTNEMPPSLATVLGDLSDGGLGPDAVADAANELLEPRAVGFVRTRERNPYKGLRAFVEADAPDFFGRSELTTRLIAALNDGHPGSRFLALVGPSGGGKSSAVRAGLVPALRAGALAPPRPMVVTDMYPGIHPLDELEEALVRVAARSHTRLGDLLRSGSRGLLEAVDLVTPEGAELVLVVDQFEELFTLAADEREREAFLDALRVCALDPQSRLVVIATLRADFYDRPLVYPRFGELLAERNVTVPPLTADELEQAIRRPAEREGMRLEPGLVAEMIADVAHQPGGLPLLQFALTELYERRDGGRLTLAAYRDIGGVTGALSARADRLFASAGTDGRRAIEQVFLRLVTLGEGRQDTRRRVAIAELDGLDVTEASLSAVLDVFGRHRLLTFDREPSTREPTVEIAHEALLRSWGRLASWIDEAREDLRRHERLARAAAEWRGSERDPSFLMTGARLDQVEEWSGTTSLSVGRSERAYIKSSVDRRDRERVAERIRAEHEAQIERRSVRRMRGLVAVFAVAALVAASLTIVATSQGKRASRETVRAQRASLESEVRELAAAATANLELDPERSILLAVEAVERTRRIDGTVLPEAEQALHQAIGASRVVASVPGIGGSVDWSPDGVFAAEGREGSGDVVISDAGTQEQLLELPAHDGDVRGVAFNEDGSLLATTGEDGRLRVWDPNSGSPLYTLEDRGSAGGPSFSSDGSLAAAWFRRKGTVRIVRASDGRTIRTIAGLQEPVDTSFSPDGDLIAVALAYKIAVFDIGSGRRVHGLTAPGWWAEFQAVGWSPDGRNIIGAAVLGARIWNAESGRARFDLASDQGVFESVDWSPDSSRIVTGHNDGTVRVWAVTDLGVRESMKLPALESRSDSFEAVFSPDGGMVLAGDAGRVFAGHPQNTLVKMWDVGIGGDAEWATVPSDGDYPGDMTFMDASHHLLVNRNDRSIQLWSLAPGADDRSLRRFDIAGSTFVWKIDRSPDDGAFAVTVDQGVSVRAISSGEELFFLEGVLNVDWHPQGGYLATVDAAGTIRILDGEGREITASHAVDGADIWDIRFSPNGRLVAVADPAYETPGEPRVWIVDWRRDEVIRTILTETETVSFDPTGTRLVTGARGGVPIVWDVTTGQVVTEITAHSGVVYDPVFSPDGSVVAAGSSDRTVRLYDPDSGATLLTLHSPDIGVTRLAFSPDGSMIATKNFGTVRVWALAIGDLLDIARRELTRGFTEEECRQYLHLERCPAAGA